MCNQPWRPGIAHLSGGWGEEQEEICSSRPSNPTPSPLWSFHWLLACPHAATGARRRAPDGRNEITRANPSAGCRLLTNPGLMKTLPRSGSEAQVAICRRSLPVPPPADPPDPAHPNIPPWILDRRIPRTEQLHEQLYAPNSMPPLYASNSMPPKLYAPNSMPPTLCPQLYAPQLYAPNAIPPPTPSQWLLLVALYPQPTVTSQFPRFNYIFELQWLNEGVFSLMGWQSLSCVSSRAGQTLEGTGLHSHCPQARASAGSPGEIHHQVDVWYLPRSPKLPAEG